MLKKLMSLILSISILSPYVSVVKADDAMQASVFNDISGHWSENAVNGLCERGIIGTDSAGFSPDSYITRSDWFIWLGKNIILPYASVDKKFSDLSDTDEGYGYIHSFRKNGVIPDEMCENNTIGKDSPITREEMLHTALLALEMRLTEKKSAITPVAPDSESISEWAKEALSKAAGYGIFVNSTQSNIRPLDNATRAEAAVVLANIYELFKTDYEYTRMRRINVTAIGTQGTGGRSYVYSALCLLYLGYDNEKANNILNDTKIINCETQADFEAAPFQMYWCMPAYIQIYLLFNSRDGILRRDVLEEETEYNMVKILKAFITSYYTNVFTEDNNPYVVAGSENHDALQKSSLYLASQILNGLEEHKDMIMPDGKTIPEFLAHAEDYYINYVTEHSKKGFHIEGADNYRMITMEALYNIIDYSRNEKVRDMVRMLMDITWIEYGIESLNGIRGSAKARVYNKKGEVDNGFLWFAMMGSLYFGLNTEHNPAPIASMLINAYRPPEISEEIAKAEDKGYYQYIKAIPGIGTYGMTTIGSVSSPMYTTDKNRDVITYTYATPDYIASTMYQDDVSALHQLSSQNRWEGAIFKGDKNARIHRYLDTERSLYGHFTSIQHGPIMIFKKNSTESYATGVYIYPFEFMENDGELPLDDGWLFGQIEDSYYAVKPLEGTLVQRDGKILLSEGESPFIIHLGSRAENCSFERFKNKIKSNLLSYNSNTVYYKDKTWGELEFNPLKTPEKARVVNNASVQYNLPYVAKSPFLNSVKNSGVFDVTYDGRHIVYDFNKVEVYEKTD